MRSQQAASTHVLSIVVIIFPAKSLNRYAFNV